MLDEGQEVLEEEQLLLGGAGDEQFLDDAGKGQLLLMEAGERQRSPESVEGSGPIVGADPP